jgi:uncharacterized iron-regulated membrane protein
VIRLQKDTAKDLIGLHGWMGVALGLLLYVVILTGTLAVFEQELATWANPLPEPVATAFPKGIGPVLNDIYQRNDPAYGDEVFVFPSADGRLRALFHSHFESDEGHGVEKGVLALIDPITLRVVDEREDEVEALFQESSSTALTDFLVDLHVRLLLPGQWGLLLTGILGFAMLAAAVTGFVIHRHLFKDMFTLRKRGDSVLTARDAHVVAGTWNLPFAFMLAFTGAFFSFGGAIGLPAIAYVAFGGDVDTVTEEVLTPPIPTDESPAPLYDLEAIFDDARQRTGLELTGLQILHWGRADASVHMSMQTPEGKLLPDHLLYQGATGEFLGVKPSLGQEPSLGGDLAGLMSPLHFGNFAGLFSKVVWFAFGFASAYVTLSGLRLWTARRREARGWVWLEKLTSWVGYGLPASLAVAAVVFLGNRFVANLFLPFILTAALLALPALRINAERYRQFMRVALGILMLTLPLVRWVNGGPAWWDASGTVVVIDALWLLCGASFLFARRRQKDLEITFQTAEQL